MTSKGKILVSFVLVFSFLSTNHILASSENHKTSKSEWKFMEDQRKLGDNDEVTNDENTNSQKVKLSKDQIQELETLTLELMEKRKELIDKYIEYGILSKEKGDLVKKHLDRHFEKMKQEQFIPRWDRVKKKDHTDSE